MNQFRDYYFRTYSVKVGTFQNLFCIFVVFLTFAVPFYVSFAGSNFWFDTKFDQVTVNYSYTGYYAIEVVSKEQSKQEFANIPYSSINGLKEHNMEVTDFTDNASFTLLLSEFGNKTVQSINGIVYYDVQIPEFERTVSCGYSFTVEGNITSADIYGAMSLTTSEPINALTEIEAKTINQPVYYTSDFQGATTYLELVQSLINNPYSIQDTKDCTKVKGNSSSRTVTLNLFKTNKVIMAYYPSVLETFKFKYSRYFGFLILSYLLFRGLMIVLIEDQGLECKIKDEKPLTSSQS